VDVHRSSTKHPRMAPAPPRASIAVGNPPSCLLLVVAGEVEERRRGRLDFVLDDESVLVLTDPTAAETVLWRNPGSIRSPRRSDRSTRT